MLLLRQSPHNAFKGYQSYILHEDQVVRNTCHGYALGDYGSHLVWEALLYSIDFGGEDSDHKRSDIEENIFEDASPNIESAWKVAMMSRCAHHTAVTSRCYYAIALNHITTTVNYLLKPRESIRLILDTTTGV